MSRYTGDMEKDLPHFALYVMAGNVTHDHEVQEYLVNRAKVVYRHNKDWGRKIVAGDAPQRDLLVNFMFHWFEGLVQAPAITARQEKLPQAFVAHVLKLVHTLPKDRITGWGENSWPARRTS